MPSKQFSGRMLLIRVSERVPHEEMRAAEELAKIHEVDVVYVDRTKGELIKNDGNGCFSLVYIAGHGNMEFLEQPNGNEHAQWDVVAQELCSSACMSDGAIVFCACCHGGMRNVARSILKTCDSVHYVCGPKSQVTTHTLILGFHTFLYNIYFRRSGAEEACEIVSKSTGHAFLAHDRQSELQANLEKSKNLN